MSDQVRWHSLGVWQIGWLVGALGVHSIPPQHNGFQVLHPVAALGLAVWGLAGSWLGRGGGGIQRMVSAGAVIAYCLLMVAADMISIPTTSWMAVLSSVVWLLAAIAMSDPTPDATAGVLTGGAALLSGAILLVSGVDRGFGWMAVGLGLAVGGVAMVIYVDPTIARGVVLCGVGVSLLGLGLVGQSGDYLIFDMVLVVGGALLGLYGISGVPTVSGRVRASPGTAGYVGGGRPLSPSGSNRGIGWLWVWIGVVAGFAGVHGLLDQAVGVDVLAYVGDGALIGLGLSGALARWGGVNVFATAAAIYGAVAVAAGTWLMVGGLWDRILAEQKGRRSGHLR